MKKMISLLVAVFIVFVSVFSTSASYKIYYDIPHRTHTLYFDRLKEYHGDYWSDSYSECYREFCYFSKENFFEPEWVLMVCDVYPEPWEYRHGALVGNRAVYTCAGPGLSKSSTGLLVYIPKTDMFIDFVNGNMEQIIELCPNFVEVIEENKIGREMGDVNDDNVVNILDATHIQCALAKKPSFYIWAIWSYPDVFSTADVDRDGEATILDATAIQRKLAKLD